MVRLLILVYALGGCGGADKDADSGNTTGMTTTGATTTGATTTGATTTGASTTGASTTGASTTGATTTGASTTSGTTTGTFVTGPEVCDDGVDNDVDGLMDCEDDDCLYDAACFEADCADSIDNDGDGRTDCGDDDCWGNGCAVSIANLQNAGPGFTRYIESGTSAIGSGCVGSPTVLPRFEIGANSVGGSVRYLGATASVWTTCTWTADSSFARHPSSAVIPLFTAVPAHRYGFALSSGCPLTDDRALPDYLALDFNVSMLFSWPLRAGGINGPAWMLWPVASYSPSVWSSTSTAYIGPSCSYQYIYSMNSNDFGPFGATQQDYVKLQP